MFFAFLFTKKNKHASGFSLRCMGASACLSVICTQRNKYWDFLFASRMTLLFHNGIDSKKGQLIKEKMLFLRKSIFPL